MFYIYLYIVYLLYIKWYSKLMGKCILLENVY